MHEHLSEEFYGVLETARQTWLRAFNESFEVIDVKIPTLKILRTFLG